ncbi:MAG: NAD(P)H-dependent oxidoreductase, partial [Clostridia bacterium]|nr:NAD(P)H-dependent oxidoreductase [Clostridia bacterium]
MKKLVAYFSASGVTAGVAEKIAKAVGADLFEIVPAQKYTDADLDWRNPQSRSTLEMKDANSRPEIVEKVENISDYGLVIIGFPVWWYTAPTIINNFIEQND